MEASAILQRARTFILPAGLFLVGCASPGTPKPPSLDLPEVVSDLQAERVGDGVRLRWTTPSKTTDGVDVRGGITAQVCRGAMQTPGDCLPVRRSLVPPGLSEAVDVLPTPLKQAPGVVLEYRIELLNESERSAGLSPPVLAAGGAAPPQVAGLLVEASPEGALLRWRSEDAADGIELKRLQVTLAAKQEKSARPGVPAPKVPAEVRLRAGGAGPNGQPFLADAGGTVDATAAREQSYVYTARRVRRVVLDGHALELRSADCPPVAVTMRDTFPPQAPIGLEAIAARVADAPVIDLSWTPNTEDDLAGYMVYRREEAATQDVAITPAVIQQPAYRDTGVTPGRKYIYTVRAVDRGRNRSSPSASARETVTP